MYLSVLAPVPGREEEAAAEWAGGPAAEHEWLAGFFTEPNAPQCATHDFLFRRSTNGVTRFHVLSSCIPRTRSGAWSVETHTYAPRFSAGRGVLIIRSPATRYFNLTYAPSLRPRKITGY